MDALTELLAREAIRDLLTRYAMAFDDRDWAAWEALWTDDLVFVVDGTPIDAPPLGVMFTEPTLSHML